MPTNSGRMRATPHILRRAESRLPDGEEEEEETVEPGVRKQLRESTEGRAVEETVGRMIGE